MSKLTLLADAGGTKTTWAVTGSKTGKQITSAGISPYFQSSNEITQLLKKELIPGIKRPGNVGEIYFYGTGCMNAENNMIIKKGLSPLFVNAKIQVSDDVYGAARALCGNEKGIACILGTGSSACYFDGKKIKEDRTGMGFILGDEGSGAYLGKKVLQYFLYKKFDDVLMKNFVYAYYTNEDEILDNVYKGAFPNKYIASFAPFLAKNRGHKMVEEILEEGINSFFAESVLPITQSKKYPIGFNGGIAYTYKDVLLKLCERNNLIPGNILKEPMDGLLKYHV